ncbi:hypothetical protein [Capnocytophaga cynodegmi]|uniref:hypothetical protein n=1 Tax=Capnocytophaga cynodegmi TaxID=28189 RepID=UPI00385C67F4
MSKIPKAIDIEAHTEITAIEYSKKQNREGIICPHCNIKISFVQEHIKNIKEQPIKIAPYFRTPRGAEHENYCKYNINKRLEKISLNNPCISILQDNKYQFNLKIITDKPKEYKKNNNEEYNHTEIYINPNNGYYLSYIRTLQDILSLRNDIEENSEIEDKVILSFGGKKIKWEDFYFTPETYYKVFDLMEEYKEKLYPVCFEGFVRWIEYNRKKSEETQTEENQENVIQTLFLYGYKHNDKTPALKLFSKAVSDELTDISYPNNTPILCYGKPIIDAKNNNPEYQNMIMWINNLNQILKIENQ